MREGVFLFGIVEMDDAGAGPPDPTERRYSQEHMWHAATRMLDMGVATERLGFDSFWLTEHHFQHEGYEVVPNALMFGAVLAERTSTLRIGAMFNIVPQWHPLKFAEDFATLHNLSGGRGILGVGRGTVPREAETLGSRIGSYDNPDKAAADDFNREVFDETMDVILAAFGNERFSYRGKHFVFPPDGIPDRGGSVQHLTLVPRPLHPYEIWQGITSPPTLTAVPTRGFGGVFWLRNHRFTQQWWEQFGVTYEQVHGRALGPGELRNLVLNVHIADSHEAAWAEARPGHDEFWKFLGPYGWSRGYADADGKPAAPGLIPTLEESVDQQVWIIGTAEEVAEQIAGYRDRLGGLENLTIFPHLPGETYEQCEEQLARWAQEVRPLL